MYLYKIIRWKQKILEYWLSDTVIVWAVIAIVPGRHQGLVCVRKFYSRQLQQSYLFSLLGGLHKDQRSSYFSSNKVFNIVFINIKVIWTYFSKISKKKKIAGKNQVTTNTSIHRLCFVLRWGGVGGSYCCHSLNTYCVLRLLRIQARWLPQLFWALKVFNELN